MAKKPSTKKTGVNKGIEKGVSTEQFKDLVICKKCGKEVEFTLGSTLFLKCPRCNARVERDIKREEKQAKKIIKWDILRRSKKAQLAFGFFLTVLAAGYNILGFFLGWFEPNWWMGLFSIPFIIIAYFCIRGTKTQSASKKYKFYAWLAGWVVLAAIIVVVATTVPAIADWIRDFLGL